MAWLTLTHLAQCPNVESDENGIWCPWQYEELRAWRRRPMGAKSDDDGEREAVVSRRHLLFLLQDDCGHHEVGWTNSDREPVTRTITSLARQGIILHRHCTFLIPPSL